MTLLLWYEELCLNTNRIQLNIHMKSTPQTLGCRSLCKETTTGTNPASLAPTHTRFHRFTAKRSSSSQMLSEGPLVITVSSDQHNERRGDDLTTGDEIRQPGQSQIGGCTCKIPLDMRVLRLFPGRKTKTGET